MAKSQVLCSQQKEGKNPFNGVNQSCPVLGSFPHFPSHSQTEVKENVPNGTQRPEKLTRVITYSNMQKTVCFTRDFFFFFFLLYMDIDTSLVWLLR